MEYSPDLVRRADGVRRDGWRTTRARPAIAESLRTARAALAITLALMTLALLTSCARRVSPLTDTSTGVSGTATPVELSSSHPGAPPPETGDGWRTAAPAALGLDDGRLAALTEAIRQQEYANVHAVLIERDGRLVYEQYFEGEDVRAGPRRVHVIFTRDTLHDLRSATKSVVSALVGIAVDRGAIRSLDQPILDFFPEYADLATPERKRITLRHALTMSAGLAWREGDVPYSDPRNDEGAMDRSGDPVRYTLARPVIEPPGTRWHYNGGLTQVLAAVVERATGQPLREYARATLFEPLGVGEWIWRGSPAGIPHAASGLMLRPRDLAKFGSLYLNGGRWNGRRVLPAEWITASTRRRIGVKDSISPYGETGYGYHWWHDRLTTERGIVESLTAVGNGQQRIFVVPEQRLVVTVLAGRYNDTAAEGLAERLLVQHVLPAVRSGDGDPRVIEARREHLDTLLRDSTVVSVARMRASLPASAARSVNAGFRTSRAHTTIHGYTALEVSRYRRISIESAAGR